MKWSFANVGLIIFGLIGVFAIVFFTELTVSNEQDYYSLKDAAEASMIESIDIAYYRLTGNIKMSQEKFVENFTRRFTKTSTYGKGNYSIKFYDISETPPKVSIRIVDATNSYNILNTIDTELDATKVDIINELSGILDVYSDKDNSGALTPASLRQHLKSSDLPDPDALVYENDPDDSGNEPDNIWEITFIDGDPVIITNDGEVYVPEDDDNPIPEITDCHQLRNSIECDVEGDEKPVVFVPKKQEPDEKTADPDSPVDEPDSIKLNVYRVTVGRVDGKSASVFLCEDVVYGLHNLFDSCIHEKYYEIIPKYKYFVEYNKKTYVSNSSKLKKMDNVSCLASGNKLNCNENISFDLLNNKDALMCFGIETTEVDGSDENTKMAGYFIPGNGLINGIYGYRGGIKIKNTGGNIELQVFVESYMPEYISKFLEGIDGYYSDNNMAYVRTSVYTWGPRGGGYARALVPMGIKVNICN